MAITPCACRGDAVNGCKIHDVLLAVGIYLDHLGARGIPPVLRRRNLPVSVPGGGGAVVHEGNEPDEDYRARILVAERFRVRKVEIDVVNNADPSRVAKKVAETLAGIAVASTFPRAPAAPIGQAAPPPKNAIAELADTLNAWVPALARALFESDPRVRERVSVVVDAGRYDAESPATLTVTTALLRAWELGNDPTTEEARWRAEANERAFAMISRLRSAPWAKP